MNVPLRELLTYACLFRKDKQAANSGEINVGTCLHGVICGTYMTACFLYLHLCCMTTQGKLLFPDFLIGSMRYIGDDEIEMVHRITIQKGECISVIGFLCHNWKSECCLLSAQPSLLHSNISIRFTLFCFVFITRLNCDAA